jgi:hypothetical protein
MNHFPQPFRGRPPLAVPFIDAGSYRRGTLGKLFASDNRQHLLGGQNSTDAIASALQSQLFFGLIQELVRGKLDIKSFLFEEQVSSGKMNIRVTLAPLGEILVDLKKRLIKQDEMMKKNELMKYGALTEDGELIKEDELTPHGEGVGLEKRLRSYLEIGLEAVRWFHGRQEAFHKPIPVILLSIHLLIEMLTWSLNEFRHEYTYVPAVVYSSRERISAPANVLVDMMIRTGKCPFQTHNLIMQHGYSVMYYLSRIETPTRRSTDHSCCSRYECIAHNVNMDSYESSHTQPDCPCPLISVDVLRMQEIVASGGIPIVQVKEGQEGHISLHVSKASQSTRYVAISHVWADGLGNPNANALPRCQLVLISRRIAAMNSNATDISGGRLNIGPISLDLSSRITTWVGNYFWLDTLCIPVGQNVEELKVKAINKMAAIYSGASSTLILDSSLQSFPARKLGSSELLARITLSAWMGRMWTFQEGALGHNPMIACADDIFDPFNGPDNDSGRAGKVGQIIEIGRNPISVAHICSSAWYWILGTKKKPDVPQNSKEKLRTVVDGMLAHHLRNKLEPQFQMLWRKSFFDFSRNSSGKTNPTILLDEFISCWNSLTNRTTTKMEDVCCIIANLLDFDASAVLEKPSEHRLATIIWSLDSVPLSLFFNSSSPRLRVTDHHNNRWIPIYPGKQKLGAYTNLKFSKNGLVFNSACAGLVYSYMVKPCLPAASQATSVNVCLGDNKLEVYFQRAANDCFRTEGFGSSLIILEEYINEDWVQGACFHVCSLEESIDDGSHDAIVMATSSNEDGKTRSILRIEAVFDCPIVARRYPRISSSKAPKEDGANIYNMEPLLSGWEITIKCGECFSSIASRVLK